ncbi:hypothetical protein [Tsuneonella flava]|uniref:hypothetical protein n=1 Tax=Tsuneonella flava TaxID=2055955 RepID=UPI000C8004D5|nr:hypothetical protein [Tsuneonella flava]
MIESFRSAIRVALAAALAMVLPAGANAQEQTTAQQQQMQQQIRQFANMYMVTDYALGANENCDLFPLGEYRGLRIFRDLLRSDLGKVLKKEQIDQLSLYDKAKAEWKGCLARANHPKQWKVIEDAHVMALAMIAAPSNIATDSKTCKVDGVYQALNPTEWRFARTASESAAVIAKRRTDYDALTKEFAAIIDQQCKKGVSQMMQPGYDSILLTEEINLYLQKGKKQVQVSTSVGTYISATPISADMGAWRSRMGSFIGNRPSLGLNVYRVLDRGDKPVVFFHLSRPGTFDPHGKILVTRQGGWIAKLRSNVDEVALNLPDGSRIALTKQSGSGSNVLGSSEFVLPPDGKAKLARLGDDAAVTVSYRMNGKEWTPFLEIGRDPPVQSQKMGNIRKALVWANAPMPAKEDRP